MAHNSYRTVYLGYIKVLLIERVFFFLQKFDFKWTGRYWSDYRSYSLRQCHDQEIEHADQTFLIYAYRRLTTLWPLALS